MRRLNPKRWKQIGNALLVGFFLLLAVFSLYDAKDWIGKKFAGFLLYDNLIISSYNLPQWREPGSQLRHPYRVVEVNDVDVRTYEEFLEKVERAPVSERVEYTLEYSGHSIKTSSTVALFEWDDFALLFVIPLVMALLFFCCGLVVWIARAESEASQSLFLSLTLAAIALVLIFDMSSTHRFMRLYLCILPLLPAALIQLSLHFPSRREFLKRFPNAQWYPYALSVFLVLILQLFFYAARDFWVLVEQFALAFLLAAGGIFVLTAIAFYRESTFTVDKLRAKVVLIGSIVAFGIPAGIALVNILGIAHLSRSITLIPLVVFPLSIVYAILRHDLFDIDIEIRRSLVAGLLNILIAIIAVVVWYIAVIFAGVETSRPYLFLVVLFTTLLAINRVYTWARGRLQRSIFKQTIRYRQAIEDLSQALISILEQAKIADLLATKVVESMQLEGAKIFLWSNEHQAYMLWGAESTGSDEEPLLVKLAPEHPIVTLLQKEEQGMMAFEIERAPRFKECRDIVLADLRLVRGEVIFPIQFHERMVGILILGRKVTGIPFNSEDMKLLKTLANNVAVALENAASYEQLRRMAQVLDQRVKERTQELLERNEQLAQAQAKLEDYSHNLEKKVEEQTRMLVQAEKMASLGTLVAGIAHEVNNPLNVIGLGLYRVQEIKKGLGSAEGVSKEALKELDEILDEFTQCYETITAVVQNLREFSYRGKGDSELVDIHHCLDTTLRLVQPQYKDHVKVEKYYGSIEPILGSAAELNQVFMNILANGFQAIPAGEKGVIQIRTWMNRRNVHVSIRDNGVGIPQEALGRIFDPFFTTKSVGKGLGLGLSISYQVMERHKGKIDIETEVGKGTEFLLTFPLPIPDTSQPQ